MQDQLTSLSTGIHPKIAWFARDMQAELRQNAHKGNWEGWGTPESMLLELEYHKAKLLIALRDKKPDLIREYLADCGNFLLFIGNHHGLYEPMSVETIQIDNLYTEEANRAATAMVRMICQQILSGTDRALALTSFREQVAGIATQFPEITDSDVRDSMAYYLDMALTERGLPITDLDDLRSL